MDIRSAIVGALIGASTCGAAWWLVERGPAGESPVASSAAATSTPKLPDVTNPLQDRAAVDLPIDSSVGPGAETLPPTSPERVGPARDIAAGPRNSSATEPTSEELRPEISTSNIARTERQKEAKELGWAYETEQLLRQFLATHKAASKFDIVLVDCRTTFCEIEAFGASEKAWFEWGLIILDLKVQPWNEFDSNGSSMDSRSDRPLIVTTLWRKQPLKLSPDAAAGVATAR